MDLIIIWALLLFDPFGIWTRALVVWTIFGLKIMDTIWPFLGWTLAITIWTLFGHSMSIIVWTNSGHSLGMCPFVVWTLSGPLLIDILWRGDFRFSKKGDKLSQKGPSKKM